MEAIPSLASVGARADHAQLRVVVSNVPAAATSLSPEQGADIVLPKELLPAQSGVAIDMAYGVEHTPLLVLAQMHGWHTVRGIDILLSQAYRQFRLWTQLPPPCAAIEHEVLPAYAASLP